MRKALVIVAAKFLINNKLGINNCLKLNCGTNVIYIAKKGSARKAVFLQMYLKCSCSCEPDKKYRHMAIQSYISIFWGSTQNKPGLQNHRPAVQVQKVLVESQNNLVVGIHLRDLGSTFESPDKNIQHDQHLQNSWTWKQKDPPCLVFEHDKVFH